VNYLGNINSFSQNDFLNGTFDNWINQIQTQAANQPCDELLTNTQSSQNMFITQNLISTLTSITATSTMTASNAVANSVSNSSNQGNPSGRRNSTNNQNTSNNGTTSNQSNTTSSGGVSSSSTTTNGGTQSGTNTGGSQPSGGGNNTQGEGTNQNGGNTSGSGNSTEGGSGQTQPPVNNPSSNPPSSNTGNGTQSGTNTGQSGGGNTQSGTNGSQGQNVPDGTTKQDGGGSGGGGTTNSVSNAASSSSGGKSSSRANVGSIVGTGDIVAIRVNDNKTNQLRGTMSITKSNTNNTKSKGMLLNFTSNVNNTNLTLYGAFNNGKRTNTLIVANSSMIDFERNFFNTTTVLDSKKFGKTALMGGLNFTVGGLAGEAFTNVSAVGGGFHPFKINQRISGNILILGVYSPFTKFYEGKWWDSGLLIVPFSSWDYTISKNFKYNVSFSGTYELKGSILQFQILTGGKILL
jgi:hypothetical protein